MLQDASGTRMAECAGDDDEIDRVRARGEWHEVDQQLRTFAMRRAALDAEEAMWLRKAERLAVWRELGHASLLDYMETVLGYGPRAALDRLRVARGLADLPETAAALSSGALSYSAVRELTRVVTPSTEAAWLEAGSGKNLREIETLVAGHRPGDLPDDPVEPDLRPRVVRFELFPETFALLRQTQAAIEDACGQRLDGDALIHALCERALASERAAAPTGAQHQIAITVCERCERGWQDAGGNVIELGAAAIELARCDAQHLGTLGADEPERAVQDIPPAARRLVWRRDHGRCTVPGCRATRHLHIHHIEHRAHAGGHEPANLTLLCGSHHRLLHAGRMTMSGRAPNELTIRNVMRPANTGPGPLVEPGAASASTHG